MNKGIYAIICKVNGKMYIGYTFDFKVRRKTHWCQMNQNKYKGKNDELQDDWNLYGKSNFKFVVIEEIDTDSINFMLQKEEDYIVRFGTLFEDRGYNISLPVSKKFRRGFIEKHGEEFLRELVCSNDDLLLKKDWMSDKDARWVKIYQIDRNSQVVRIWNSKGKVREFYKISEKSLERITFESSSGGGKKRKTWRGYVWVAEGKYDEHFDYSVAFVRKKQVKKVKAMVARKNQIDTNVNKKPVSFQNIETGEVYNFESQSQAERILGFKVNPLVKGFKQKGGGRKVNVTQWRGWKLYNPVPVIACI